MAGPPGEEFCAAGGQVTGEVVQVPVPGVAAGSGAHCRGDVVGESVPVDEEVFGPWVKEHEVGKVQRKRLRAGGTGVQGEAPVVRGHGVHASIPDVGGVSRPSRPGLYRRCGALQPVSVGHGSPVRVRRLWPDHKVFGNGSVSKPAKASLAVLSKHHMKYLQKFFSDWTRLLNRPHAANHRPFVFSDAVELLEGKTSPAVEIGDRIATATLLTAGVVGYPGAFSLLGPKNAVVKLCEQLQAKIPSEVSESRGVDRTNLLIAAHSIIVITSFFDAASLIQGQIAEAEVELTGKEELQMTKRDKSGIRMGGLVDFLVSTEIPFPKPELARGELQAHLSEFYVNLAASLSRFCQGLVFWDDLDDRKRRIVSDYLELEVPKLALRSYQNSLRKLATEVREFEIWLNLLAVQGLRSSIREQGEEASEKLGRVLLAQRSAAEKFDELQRFLRHLATDLQTPSVGKFDLVGKINSVTQLSLIPPDVARLKGESGASIPALSELYIEPPFKVISSDSQTHVSKEAWWASIDARHDLDDFFSSYLTATPAAFTKPLLVLGHPGSGKSSLTRVLAAGISGTSFVPVRVELRRVTPSQGIEVQIEEGLSTLLGRTTTWAEFRRSTSLTPVIFLDGLDELIQASDEKQADYLEQVQSFQQRELSSGGAFVIVTSRTVVADQARIPPDSLVLKIDDFGMPEISAFIRTWNASNDAYFCRVGLRPLPEELPREVAQLAGQPLLLLLLALLDAENNSLQSDAATRTRASTYRQILSTFIGREVLKHQPRMDDHEAEGVVERELLMLSYIALGMFNRGVQMMSTKQVAEDLAALASDSGRTTQIDTVQKLLGRFFFVHQAQSKAIDGSQSAYEFLHSTFGEYLVAHLAYEILSEVRDEAERMMSSRFTQGRNADQWASLLFSFEPLSQRTQILEFFSELAAEPAENSNMSELLVSLAVARVKAGGDDLSSQEQYRPADRTRAAKLATYTCNLLLLACCMPPLPRPDGGMVRAIVRTARDWDRLVFLWKSQLEESAWEQLSQVLWARSSALLSARNDEDVEVGLDFLAPATSSRYHPQPVPAPAETLSESLQAIREESPLAKTSLELITASTDVGFRGIVAPSVKQYFLAGEEGRFYFDIEDLLYQFENPGAGGLSKDLAEAALLYMIDSSICHAWLRKHLRLIVSSAIIDDFQKSTIEQLVELTISAPPDDRHTFFSVVNVLVDAQMGTSLHRLVDAAIGGVNNHDAYFAARPAFALRLGAALHRGDYHRWYTPLSDWRQLISRVSLTQLHDEDPAAPLVAVSLARRISFDMWVTSKGIVEASSLPVPTLRRMPVEDAFFLVKCGERDPMEGLRKVQSFSRAWADANSDGWSNRNNQLAVKLRSIPGRPSISLQAAIDTLS